MSALPNGIALVAKKTSNQPRARGFLHIVRHGAGLSAFYIVTYHRLDRIGRATESDAGRRGSGTDRSAGTDRRDFRLREVRGALEDILRLGSANIPDLWLSDEEMLERGLVEG